MEYEVDVAGEPSEVNQIFYVRLEVVCFERVVTPRGRTKFIWMVGYGSGPRSGPGLIRRPGWLEALCLTFFSIRRQRLDKKSHVKLVP